MGDNFKNDVTSEVRNLKNLPLTIGLLHTITGTISVCGKCWLH